MRRLLPTILVALVLGACSSDSGNLDVNGANNAAPDAQSSDTNESTNNDVSSDAGHTSTRCATDADCQEDQTCQATTGQCVSRSCLTEGCPAGQYCDPTALECKTPPEGDDPVFQAETLAGHNIQQHLSTRDSNGISALGLFQLIVAESTGRYLYVVDNAVLRIDQATGRVETISGIGWPGYADGPAEIAQFDTNFYQAGGIGISPDNQFLYVTNTHDAIRKVDLTTGAASTLTSPVIEGKTVRGMAIGKKTGAVYISGYGDFYAVMQPDGTTESRPLTPAWGLDMGAPPGYIVVDEERGWVYGLERNRQGGAFYRWPVAGGDAEWLNHAATADRDAQYSSDGPVANLQMANPAGMSIDARGFVYIGAGDGRTFRRYNPDTGLVDSLCTVDGTEVDEGRFQWCIGDGVRNKLFGTWPSILAFDDAGNGFFGYSVWPRLIRLKRVE